MTRLSRPQVLLLPALVLTTVLTGCGGGSSSVSGTSSPSEWASALCGSLKDLPGHAQDLQTELQEKAKDVVTDPKSVRDAFADALGVLKDDFTGGVTALKKAGSPDVKNGKEIQTDVVTALDNVASLFADAQEKVSKTEPTQAALVDAFTSVGGTVSEGFQKFSKTFDELDSKSGELKKAGEDNKDCKQLEG